MAKDHHAALVLTVKDGGVLHEVALAEVEGVGLVAGKATVDIDRITDIVGVLGAGGVAIVGAGGHANIGEVAIGFIGGRSHLHSGVDVGEGILPRGTVAFARCVGFDVDMLVAYRGGGESEVGVL